MRVRNAHTIHRECTENLLLWISNTCTYTPAGIFIQRVTHWHIYSNNWFRIGTDTCSAYIHASDILGNIAALTHTWLLDIVLIQTWYVSLCVWFHGPKNMRRMNICAAFNYTSMKPRNKMTSRLLIAGCWCGNLVFLVLFTISFRVCVFYIWSNFIKLIELA